TNGISLGERIRSS
ncbi:hypothetical protein V3C99_000254, partial [Haemonchus contortus]